jgi:hypothetical protein
MDVNGPFCLDLITFESTSSVVLSESPLQPGHAIYCKSTRSSFSKNPCIAWLQKASIAMILEGLSLQDKQRSVPPKKTRACLSQAPTKRGVCASLPAALLLPVDATHVKGAHGVHLVLDLDFESIGLRSPKQVGLLLGLGLPGPKQVGLLLGLGLPGPKQVGPLLGLGLGLLGPKQIGPPLRAPPWTRTPGSKPSRAPTWTRTPGSKATRTPPWTRTPGSAPGSDS